MNWQPRLHRDDPRHLYAQLLDCLIDDIRMGHLPAGTKLPTVRQLASQLSVTPGTINKVFALAHEKGLVEKTQGRGTFVSQSREHPGPPATMLSGREDSFDFTINQPVSLELATIINAHMREISHENDHTLWNSYGTTQGPLWAREPLCQWINNRGASATPEQLFITSGAQQGLLSTLMLLCKKGDSVMVQSLTFPGIKAIASMLGLHLEPVNMDSQGLDLVHFEETCKQSLSKVLVVLPSAHNPTGLTMDIAHREALVDIARRYQVSLIEDDLYLHEHRVTALQALAPERTFYISGFSKCVAPALRVGMLVAPLQHVSAISRVIQAQNWMTAPVLSAIAKRLFDSGDVSRIEQARMAENQQRINLTQHLLHQHQLSFDAVNLHVWLRHSSRRDNAEVISRLHQRGVDVLPASFFHAKGEAMPYLRLCIGNQSMAQLEAGLTQIAQELAPSIFERPLI